jgi:addiction module HigA family antidote
MHNPVHPGEILLELYMKPLGVSINETAEALKVTRKHVSAIVNGRAAITPDMALRLAAAFRTEPDIWLSLQAQYDLAQVKKRRSKLGIKALASRKAA